MRKSTTTTKPWIGYIRVSTEDQAVSGLGLSDQEQKVRGYALAKGVAVEIIADEGFSAKSLNRPGAEKIMAMIERRLIAGVIVAKLDRLTRSIGDLATLVKLFDRCGVALASCAESFDTATAGGRMILNMIGVIAQWEREVIAERTRDGLAQLQRRGEHAGMVRYGYRSSGIKKAGGTGKLLENKAEQKIVRLIVAEREAGKSLREIAEHLNALDFRTRRGTPWRVQYVDNVLRRNKETAND